MPIEPGKVDANYNVIISETSKQLRRAMEDMILELRQIQAYIISGCSIRFAYSRRKMELLITLDSVVYYSLQSNQYLDDTH